MAGNDYIGYPSYASPMSGYYSRNQHIGQMGYYQQPQNGLIRVTGIEGAKAYQMPPNSMAALFDSGSDVFFFKTTDGAGFPTIKAYSFTPVDINGNGAGEYVTRKEFDELKGLIMNGKQLIRDANNADTADS